MTADELQEAKDELAILKAERTRHLTRGRVVSAGNGGESVTRAYASYDALVARIRELEAEIRSADPCSYGALHIR